MNARRLCLAMDFARDPHLPFQGLGGVRSALVCCARSNHPKCCELVVELLVTAEYFCE